MISLVLALGNIGRKYEATRHNLGFEVASKFLEKYKLKLNAENSEYYWAEWDRTDSKIILAMPKTLMNRSGAAATALLQHYQLTPSRMLVIVDDLNLPLGKIRLRSSGSDGGHNGLGSLIYSLESEDFPRLRLGIGPLPENADQSDFVLSNFKTGELESVKNMIATASEAVEFVIEHGLEDAMTKYNNNPV